MGPDPVLSWAVLPKPFQGLLGRYRDLIGSHVVPGTPRVEHRKGQDGEEDGHGQAVPRAAGRTGGHRSRPKLAMRSTRAPPSKAIKGTMYR